MKNYLILLLLVASIVDAQAQTGSQKNTSYLKNRALLIPVKYKQLPLGSIKPQAWLLDQLERMASGSTGMLDLLYPEVVGDRNGWLGGDGDGWERGPYWIDGLLPLAYLLEIDSLKAKAQKWVNWTLDNQAESGYIGPTPFETKPSYEQGLQRGMRKDWWPKMVMLKILKQYYSATNDERVIEAMTRYFKYQLNELPKRPLDAHTFWANRRGGDNLMVVYWLYNITGDRFLLNLANLLVEQTFPWSQVFMNEPQADKQPSVASYLSMQSYPFDSLEIARTNLVDIGGIHTVNLAQGLKQPALLYQLTGERKYLDALNRGLKTLKKYHGQEQGMYGADEPLHGNKPIQGVEFCSVSEKMFSLATILQITGEMEYADLLERITYNALPTQASDDFMLRQYFQAAN